MFSLHDKIKKILNRQLHLYKDRTVLEYRKALYLLSVTYLSFILGLVLFVVYSLIGIEGTVFFLVVMGLSALMNTCIRKGYLKVAIFLLIIVLTYNNLFYYPTLPAGYDASIVSEVIITYTIWMIIAYRWWHLILGLFFVLSVVANRLYIIHEAYSNNLIEPSLQIILWDAYIMVVVFSLIGLLISYVVSREIQLSQEELNTIRKRALMLKRINAFRLSIPEEDLAENAHSYIDDMTHFLNRNAFDEFFLKQYKHLEEQSIEFVFIFVDLNCLKLVNDT